MAGYSMAKTRAPPDQTTGAKEPFAETLTAFDPFATPRTSPEQLRCDRQLYPRGRFSHYDNDRPCNVYEHQHRRHHADLVGGGDTGFQRQHLYVGREPARSLRHHARGAEWRLYRYGDCLLFYQRRTVRRQEEYPGLLRYRSG